MLSATTGTLLPSRYLEASEADLRNRILSAQSAHRGHLVIVAHHYQRPEVVAVADYRGDSFGLSRWAAQQDAARYIVFCGVHFMAESAAVLARPRQTVQLPDLRAGCPLAEMAEADEVARAVDVLRRINPKEPLIPLTYMNSTAELKAFCGRHGGAVCTSSNASRVFSWALKKGRVLFLPDEHLGRNTARQLGIGQAELVVWERTKELGGQAEESLARARVILWNGFCHVHTWFTTEHIGQVRRQFPGVRVLVHPECREAVVQAADGAGSTEYLVQEVQRASPGSTLAIGTEINLVRRLASEHPDRTVIPLARSFCPNMFRINLANLCWVVEHPGEVQVVQVEEGVRQDARLALQRMLELS